MIMNNIKIAKKKPIEIEVIQITGTDENIKEIQNFCGRWSFKRDEWVDLNYCVETIEGIMSCHKNDWIVKGVEGEVYAIKNAIFEKTYDIIGEYKYQGIATPR
jgi:hypothetical protein